VGGLDPVSPKAGEITSISQYDLTINGQGIGDLLDCLIFDNADKRQQGCLN